MSEISYEDALAHFGVKGMKWGVRRSQNAQLNKASRQADKKAREDAIDKARQRVSSGQSGKAIKKARQQYKIDKKTMGSREAKKILQKHKDKAYNDYYKANETKNGKEFAKNYAIAVGTTIAVSALIGLAKS